MLAPTAKGQNDADLFAAREVVGEKKVTAALAVTKTPEEFAAFDEAGLTKYVSVFGVHVYATADSPGEKILHAAKVVAEYIDNDEDGMPDNLFMLSNMISNDAAVVMTGPDSSLRDIERKLRDHPRYRYTLSLGSNEARPGFINEDGSVNRAVEQDGALEEVWHLFCDAGFGLAYPEIFGRRAGTAVANCMDAARGGKFAEVPTDGPKKGYPAKAWYYYDDAGCSYSCMLTEYLYWGTTSLLGVQEFNRANRPASGEGESGEWGAYTPELMRSLDPCLTGLLTNPAYKIPAKTPDGRYAPSAFPTVTVPLLKVQDE